MMLFACTPIACRWSSVTPDPVRPSPALSTPLPQSDLSLNGLRLRYVDVGSSHVPDVAPLLLVPGHTSRIEEYDALVPHLAVGRRVIVLDLPGSGYSSKPERSYDLHYYEDVILEFLDALHLERLDVGGGSLGGNLALRLARRDPARFRKVAAWAPGSAWEARPRLAGWMRRIASYWTFLPTVAVQSRYWYRSDFLEREDLLRRTWAYYDEVMSPGFVAMYWGIAADQVGTSLFDIAHEIEPPVLLCWGELDHGARMGDGVRRLHALLSSSELVVIPGAGHALANEVPVALAHEIRRFLARGSD